MLKLIVGLGNPGQRYEKTRHNAGFLFLDDLLLGRGCSWQNESRFGGVMTKCQLGGVQVSLLKPQLFMNKSGGAVGKVARYYKILPEEILVVHDELDLEEGVVRIKKGGGHAGHNGLRDIIAHLGSKDFYRLRIGIGRPSVAGDVADYVLAQPSLAGKERLADVFRFVIGYMDKIVEGDMAQVMNEMHAQLRIK